MDEIKLTERRILLWGTFAFLVLMVIDVALFFATIENKHRIDIVREEKQTQHAMIDSLITTHAAHVDSLFKDLRDRLGVDDYSPYEK